MGFNEESIVLELFRAECRICLLIGASFPSSLMYRSLRSACVSSPFRHIPLAIHELTAMIDHLLMFKSRRSMIEFIRESRL